MRITFRKPRWYQGKRYSPGDTVDADLRYARAFIDTKAAIAAARMAPTPARPARRRMPAPDVETFVPEPAPKEEVEETSLEDLSYRELQELCRARNLSAFGKKADLVTRLTE